MLLLEIGNTTIKLALSDGTTISEPERYDAVPAALSRIGALGEPVLCAPVGHALSERMLEALADHEQVTVIERGMLARFIGDSYDTPETLGIDRVLNLAGSAGDAVVISCGTAITVDAIVEGRPQWGAIMPGFRCAAEGLHQRIPSLPLVTQENAPALPARTSLDSVANGVLLGTARAAQALALAVSPGETERVVLTGGDAELLARLWEGDLPEIDDRLVFRGMLKLREMVAP